MANKKTKLQPHVKTQEEKAIRNKIKSGKLPRYYLAKDPKDDRRLARKEVPYVIRYNNGLSSYTTRKSKITWVILSTYAALTAK